MMDQIYKLKLDSHNAGVALRKALVMYEGSELFLDEERRATALDIMADYCVQALKILGEWREDDEEGGDPDEVE